MFKKIVGVFSLSRTGLGTADAFLAVKFSGTIWLKSTHGSE
jgi:hypothetical protein